MPSIRILTLNIWGIHGDWPTRRAVLKKGLAALSPDLITFQESVRTDDYDQVLDLVGDEYRVLHQEGRSSDGVGASIASRWPLQEIEQMFLDVTPRIAPSWIGSVAAVLVEVPGPVGTLALVHHKPSWQWGYEHERELQAVAAARFIERIVSNQVAHVVVAGDLDASPDSGSIRFWKGRQSLDGMSVCYLDAWEAVDTGGTGHTFSPRNPLVPGGEMPSQRGRRIDYIFIRCNDHGPTLDVSSCALAFDHPDGGVWASDHFGVVADLTAAADGTPS